MCNKQIRNIHVYCKIFIEATFKVTFTKQNYYFIFLCGLLINVKINKFCCALLYFIMQSFKLKFYNIIYYLYLVELFDKRKIGLEIVSNNR